MTRRRSSRLSNLPDAAVATAQGDPVALSPAPRTITVSPHSGSAEPPHQQSPPPLQQHNDNDDEASTVNDTQPEETYYFDGVVYSSYQEMVQAKRQRNQQVLLDSGLLEAAQELQRHSTRRVTPSSQKRRKLNTHTSLPRRSSNRIKGIQSDGLYVEDERAGRFVVGGSGGERTPAESIVTGEEGAAEPSTYGNRINDGSDLTVPQAVERAGFHAEEVLEAQTFLRNLEPVYQLENPTRAGTSSRNNALPYGNLDVLRVETVAKVTRERIYSIATHTSTNQLIVAAGDKQGHVGLWNVDAFRETESHEPSISEFKYHAGAVNSLLFTDQKSLLSCSYDGTVRLFDLQKQSMSQVFAAYDDSEEFKDRLGYKLDTGYNFWTQYLALDHRVSNGMAFFASTSTGTVFHVDLRANEMTFKNDLSDKKINSVSLHPNGYSLLTAGLDCHVALWDLRKFNNTKKSLSPVSSYHSGKSVNSAFFSPSGKYVVSTTMADRLDIFTDLHLATSTSSKPTKKHVHDNRTGRWLSTFMATWHPSLDIFCVGSMRRPREIQVYNATEQLRNITGEDLTAVASRCCFHANSDKLAMVGGNSSGRVTVIR